MNWSTFWRHVRGFLCTVTGHAFGGGGVFTVGQSFCSRCFSDSGSGTYEDFYQETRRRGERCQCGWIYGRQCEFARCPNCGEAWKPPDAAHPPPEGQGRG